MEGLAAPIVDKRIVRGCTVRRVRVCTVRVCIVRKRIGRKDIVRKRIADDPGVGLRGTSDVVQRLPVQDQDSPPDI